MGVRIRDAVHGDLEFAELEEYCMRTHVFQRLHTIKQLGNAFHAYPSAMHTRFEHSLGVCYQVKKIISSVNRRRFGLIDNGSERILGLAGLLHDITHFPFKHTLERDSGLLEKEKRDITYRRRFEQMNLRQKLSEDEIELLVEILAVGNPDDHTIPYQAQIIQDTFSADILDYVRRDAHFTGIKRDYDERIYDHIDIINNAGKDFLGINLTDEFGKNTASAMTELINLLEVRYVLNERVYFYPVKIAADSLLVKALRVLSSEERNKLQTDIEDMSDEQVVSFLANSDNELANFYGNLLKNRQLPKSACSFRQRTDFPNMNEFAKIITNFRGWSNVDKWERCEAQIAKEAGTDPTKIIIYCHDPAMQRKTELLEVLFIDESGKPRKLRQHERQAEISLLSDKHVNLWACHVFSIDRDEEVIKRIKQVARGIMLSA